MIESKLYFVTLCFFSLGFLTLVFIMSLFLNIFLKSKLYKFYTLYIISVLVFIVAVYIKELDFLNRKNKYILLIGIDIIQIINNLLFSIFIYQALINFDKKYEKLSIFIKLFVAFLMINIGIAITFPDFFRVNLVLFLISRIIIFSITVPFYVVICKNLNIPYFKYLFAATTILYVTGLMALFDSFFNFTNIKFNNAFLYLCMGFFIENISFIGLITYNYFFEKKRQIQKDIEHQKELLFTQIEIQNQTMQQIGIDIHDNIGQKLTLASLYTQQLAFENKAPQINENIDNVSDIINQSLIELRNLSKSLTDNNVDNDTLSQLITKECENINKLKKSKVIFEDFSSTRLLPYQVKNIIYRITQEFLQNSIKHGNCKTISIILDEKINHIILNLSDDGKGFDVINNKSLGIGLKNMKTRTEILKGSFLLKSELGKGTQLKIEIPIIKNVV